MSVFLCKKCNSSSFFIKENGPHKSIYCKDCGAWQKNLGKDELNKYTYELKALKNSQPQEENLYKKVYEYCNSRNNCEAFGNTSACSFYSYQNGEMQCMFKVKPFNWIDEHMEDE